MKKLVLATVISLFPAVKTFACSQPLPAIHQKFQLERALKSEAFGKALNKILQRDRYVSIEKVEFAGGVNVKLSNNCTINLVSRYGVPRHPGLCPEYLGTEARTVCE